MTYYRLKKLTNPKKSMLSSLPGIGMKYTTAMIDPVSKPLYGKIWIGIVNNIYDKIMNDEKNTTTTYKTSWLLDTAGSRRYGDNNTKVRKRRRYNQD